MAMLPRLHLAFAVLLLCAERSRAACASTDDAAECSALLTLFTAMKGKFWRKNSGWGTSQSYCGWYGVACRELRVSSIILSDNLVKGTVPAALADLGFLKHLDLSDNHISGTLPSEVGHAMTIERLRLADNALSGTISDDFGYLLALVELDLSGNLLTGGMEAISKLHAIQILRLQKNSFQSVDLADFGQLSLLEELNLENNGLPGVLPESWPYGGRLRLLNVGGNALSGTIPLALFDHTPLLESFVANANALEGPIPWSHWSSRNLTHVRTLELQHNQLSGGIDASVAKALPSLEVLRLQNNGLSGTLPPTLADLLSLAELRASSNKLGPALPATAALCSLFSLPNEGVAYCDLAQNAPLEAPIACEEVPACLTLHCGVATCAPTPSPTPDGLPRPNATHQSSGNDDGRVGGLTAEWLLVVVTSATTVGLFVLAVLGVLCVAVLVLGPNKIGRCCANARGKKLAESDAMRGRRSAADDVEMRGLAQDRDADGSGTGAPHPGHLAATLLRYINEEVAPSLSSGGGSGMAGRRQQRARRAGRGQRLRREMSSSDEEATEESELMSTDATLDESPLTVSGLETLEETETTTEDDVSSSSMEFHSEE